MPTPDVAIETMQAEVMEGQRRAERIQGREEMRASEQLADQLKEMLARDAWRQERLRAD